MYCRKCGKKYPKEYRFCETCGGELEDELNVLGEQFYDGEEGAFEAIYGESEKWVRAYVYHRVSAADVEDCMQNIYVKLYEKINLFDKKKASFRVWFNALLKNETTDFVRKYSSKQGKDEFLFVGEEGEDIDLGLESADESPDIVMDKAETTRLIREILGGISEEQRVCIMLYYLEGKKQNEITEELCISAGTVKSRLHYGKEKVKEEVLKLEKQGTKLYGLAPFPFFIWLLQSEDTLAASAAASAAATPMNLETARAATKAAGAAAGKTVTVKIVTGIVIAGILGGGGYAAYKHFAGQPQMMPTIDGFAKDKEDDMQVVQNNAGIDELEKTVDYNELQNVLTYLPCYESVDELTDDTYSDIFLRGTIYRYLQTSTGTNIEQIIPENEVLAINSQNSDVGYSNGSNITLKASAFDRFIDLLDSRVKPQEIISEAWPSQMYRFKNNQYEADMDGLGGVSSYSVVLRNTVIGEDNIAVNYYYKEEIAGNITEEERHAVLMKSEMGYCIGQIRSGTVQEEAASKEEDIVSDNEELYADIITAYRNLYEGITEEEPLISEISLWEVRKDVALQYAFYDIDGNGVDECLFSQEAEGIAQGDTWVKNDKSYFGIWTWEDETAVLVKPEQVGRLYGNPMTLLTICEDGIIRCYDYIGSRDEMWDFYKMNGSSLKSVNSYSRQNNWDGMIAEFPQGQILLDDEENQITEEQVDRVNESYPEIRDTIQWKNL